MRWRNRLAWTLVIAVALIGLMCILYLIGTAALGLPT